MADKIKWIVAALLVVGALAGFYWFEQYSLLIRVPALLAAAIICVVIVVQTTAGRQLVGFFRESQIEVRKVVWPTGKETTQTTLVVMALVVAVAVFLWLLDMFLLWSVKLLTGQGG
jgi:preprotein translocase subunit SecE